MWFIMVWISSVQFSHSVMSDCLRPHETLHARPPCPSPTPRDHSDPFPLCQWCHPTISSSVVPFSSCPQSFPASGSFQISQLSASGGQKYCSFTFNISPSKEHPGLISFKMDWMDLLAVQGSQESFTTPQFKSINYIALSFLIVQLSHPYMTNGKTIGLTRRTFGLCFLICCLDWS